MSPVRLGSGRAPTTGRFRRYAHSHPARNCPSRCPPPSRSACTSDHQAHSVPHHVQLIPRGYTSDLKATPRPTNRQPIGNPKPPSCDPQARYKPPESPGKAWSSMRRRARMSGLTGRHVEQLGVCRAALALRCPRLAQLGFGSLNHGHSTTASRKPCSMSFQGRSGVSEPPTYQWKPLRTRVLDAQAVSESPPPEARVHTNRELPAPSTTGLATVLR